MRERKPGRENRNLSATVCINLPISSSSRDCINLSLDNFFFIFFFSPAPIEEGVGNQEVIINRESTVVEKKKGRTINRQMLVA